MEKPTRKAPTLSYSRLSDYRQCPLKYRYAMVDLLPQPPQMHLAFGTLVHQVLENLYALPPVQRTLEAAQADIPAAWQSTLAQHPEYRELFTAPAEENVLLEKVAGTLASYFQIESPAALQSSETESEVESVTSQGVAIRGFIDRLDTNPRNGALRVVDYKTGKLPHPRFMDKAVNQLRFYALLLKNSKAQAPQRAQLVYLEAQKVFTLDPLPRDYNQIEDLIHRTWNDMEADLQSGNFSPRTSRLCDWCAFQSRCPAFGAQPLPFPRERADYLLEIRRS